MFTLSVPWWEFVVRGVAVYAFLLVFLRLTGRRGGAVGPGRREGVAAGERGTTRNSGNSARKGDESEQGERKLIWT